MQNLWSDSDAKAAIAQHAAKGIGEDLALRVYTTRLLGGEPRLVLHGGGNTSVKTKVADITGSAVDVLCVKGSGWDMGTIEAPGLPAVRLEPLRELVGLQALSDEDMVNVQRCNLLDSKSPNPSVETLLHAFLPHKFIDHTHSNAVLALTDQPDGEALAADVYGKRAALVPYVMPGFALAKKTNEVSRANPDVEGLILLKHGIFSMGATAEEAYVRMIDLVTLAEKRLAKATRKIFPGVSLPGKIAAAADVAPILRGLISLPAKDGGREAAQRFVFEFRTNPGILAYVGGKEIARYSQQGPVTPDHAIRTKGVPLVVPAPEAGKLDTFAKDAKAALDTFVADYHAYFQRHNVRQMPSKTELDPDAARRAGAGARPVRRRQHVEGRQDRSRPRRDHGRGGGRCRAARHLRVHPRARHLRHRVLVAGAGQARCCGGEADGAAHRRRHRRRLGHRCGDGGRLRQGRRGGCRARPRRVQGQGHGHRLRRHGARHRCAPPSTGSRRPMAASTSSSPTPAPPGRAASATFQTRSCARASS